MPKYQKIILLTIFGVLVFVYNDCGKVQFSNVPAAAVSTTGTPGGPVVCNPFGGSGGGSAKNGLVGNEIHYLGQDQIDSNNSPIPSIATFNDLWSKADGIFDLTLILNSINTPNRYFAQGFSDGTNPPLSAGGQTLIQFFGFQLKSTFVLGNLPVGSYQLAVLSDDGSNLTISGGQANGGDFVINNDGTHSLQMGCFNSKSPSAPPVLNLTSTSQYPLEFDYYQGPRVTIGLMLMYRPMPPGNPADVQCGRGSGNDGDQYFFVDNDGKGNPISPSTPTAAFNSLLTEANPWTVVPTTNYVLPSSNPVNPCN